MVVVIGLKRIGCSSTMYILMGSEEASPGSEWCKTEKDFKMGRTFIAFSEWIFTDIDSAILSQNKRLKVKNDCLI